MKKPNFFILGAPKAGTTSIASWLSEHPSVFMSLPKEPGYFNTEQPKRLVPRLRDYERLFSAAPATVTVLGEASTGYLSSNCAVANILSYNPSARFLVCLRNPLEMVPSLHNEYLKAGRQWERSLEATWRQQQQGDNALNITANNYARMCRLGEQVERLLNQIPPDQALFIWTDDLKSQTAHEYSRLLDFLKIPHDGRTQFPVLNTRQMPISRTFAVAARLGRRGLYRLGIAAPFRAVGKRLLAATTKVTPATPEQGISPAFRAELQAYFHDDIQKLSGLLQRNLSAWLN